MPTDHRVIVEAINCSRRAVRQEIAEWLRGARLLRRHGLHPDAAFIERHAANYKALAGARPIPV